MKKVVRVSSSVKAFSKKIEKVWGLKKWKGIDSKDQDVLFFGLYTQKDYDAFRRHQGRKTVFWCGSDLIRLLMDYDKQRILKLFPEAEHWVENEEEADKLRKLGIEPNIAPSFLEDVNDFPVSFKPSKKPHIWLCSHPEREEEYGVNTVETIAPELPDFTFHIYGIGGESHDNVEYHGKVPQKEFNKDIKKYHSGIRLNEHDGNSEVPMKSVLLGQYPITRIKYDKLWHYVSEDMLLEKLKKVAEQTEPNLEAREYWISHINNYPWIK